MYILSINLRTKTPFGFNATANYTCIVPYYCKIYDN